MNFTIEPVDPIELSKLQRTSKKIALSTRVEPKVYDTVQLCARAVKRGLLEGFKESRGYEVAHEKGTWLSFDGMS